MKIQRSALLATVLLSCQGGNVPRDDGIAARGIVVEDVTARAQADVGGESHMTMVIENRTALSVAIRQVQCAGAGDAHFEGQVRVYAAPKPEGQSQGVEHAQRSETIDSVLVGPGESMQLDPLGVIVRLGALAQPLRAGARLECHLETSSGRVPFVAVIR
jgi:hypothetical protein